MIPVRCRKPDGSVHQALNRSDLLIDSLPHIQKEKGG